MAGENQEVVAPVPGSPEYDAAMAAKVDDSAAKALESAEGAPLVAPTEATEEAGEKAKVEGEGEPVEDANKKPEGETEGSQDEAAKAVEAAGLDYSKLQTEWENGGLTEESYQALEKVGFSKEIVDQHIAGQEALAALHVMQAEEAAGGKEQLNAMQVWAKTSMSDAEIAAYNNAVMGNKEEMTQAILGLRSRYEAEYGRAPGLLGGRNADSAPAGYASRAEMTAEMRDPRYSKDPAFRAKVSAKVAATTAF